MNRFEAVKKEVEKILGASKSSHDWDHTQRVYRLAVHIAGKEHADIKVVRYAAILHDIARRREDVSGGKIDHAALGAVMSAKILKKFRFKEDFISAVRHCVAAHRFRGELKPETPEAKTLFDADKLDSIGAVGIGRAFLFAGEVGAKLHNSKGVNVEKTLAYTKEDTAYREYMVKLRHIKDRMQTAEGRKLAVERDNFMAVFFGRLEKEINADL